MLSQNDSENLNKAVQCANLLAQDLKAIVSADNPLLGEIALGLLSEAAAIEQKLQRLLVITKP